MFLQPYILAGAEGYYRGCSSMNLASVFTSLILPYTSMILAEIETPLASLGLSRVRYTPMASFKSWGWAVRFLFRFMPLASPLTMTLVTGIQPFEIHCFFPQRTFCPAVSQNTTKSLITEKKLPLLLCCRMCNVQWALLEDIGSCFFFIVAAFLISSLDTWDRGYDCILHGQVQFVGNRTFPTVLSVSLCLM